MARPIKEGLDYFPHDCIPDHRLELIEAEFGLTGYAVVLKLYERIFVEKGYFCEWTTDMVLMFTHKNSVDGNVVSEIVKASLRRGIFDSRLYEKYSILTSADIQETYLKVTERRKQVFLFEEYLLLDCTHFADNVVINSVNADINAGKCRRKSTKEKKGK